MLFQPIIDALDIATGNGWLELPSGYGERVFALAKGLQHKYYKRVPKSGGGYRYFYKVGHGGTVANADHFVEGAAFQHDGGHFHIKAVDGDKLTIEHDETGEKKTVTKTQLRGMLTERHGKELDAHRAKVHADLADARKAGASPKQIARLEARVKAAGDGKGDDKGDNSGQPADVKTKQAVSPEEKLDKEATEYMRHRREDATKPRTMKEWHDTVSAEHDKGGDWHRHVPAAVKTVKKSYTIATPKGEPKEVAGEVAGGVWGLHDGTVTHIPTGLSVFSGDAGARHALAVYATHAPGWGADAVFGDVKSISKKIPEIADAGQFLKSFMHQAATRRMNELSSRASRLATASAKASAVQTSGPSGAFKSKVTEHDFDKAHKRAAAFSATDVGRPSVNAVYSEGDGRLISTDGHRIAIIPTSHRKAGLYHNKTKAPVDEAYPDYRKAMKLTDDYKTSEYDADSLRSSIRAHVAELDRQGRAKYGHTAVFSPDGITSNANKADTHKVGHTGEITTVGVDPKYMLDALAGAKGTVRLKTAGSQNPIHIERADGEYHVVMPKRI